jgi:hypothetical protein
LHQFALWRDLRASKLLRLQLSQDSGLTVHIVERENIDRLVISLAERRGTMPVQQLLDLKFAGVQVEDAHTTFEEMRQAHVDAVGLCDYSGNDESTPFGTGCEVTGFLADRYQERHSNECNRRRA